MSAEALESGQPADAADLHAAGEQATTAAVPEDMASMVLPGEFTIYQVASLGTEVADRLAAGGNIELDGSTVTEIDAAGVQFLLACRRHAAAWDRNFSLTSVSPELAATLALLGLDLATHPALPQ
jgi:anti-anti-sigma regulatory factor